MVAGALQIAASRMFVQLTIERMGETELYEGFRQVEAVREERRKEWQARLRAERPKATRRKSTKR